MVKRRRCINSQSSTSRVLPWPHIEKYRLVKIMRGNLREPNESRKSLNYCGSLENWPGIWETAFEWRLHPKFRTTRRNFFDLFISFVNCWWRVSGTAHWSQIKKHPTIVEVFVEGQWPFQLVGQNDLKEHLHQLVRMFNYLPPEVIRKSSNELVNKQRLVSIIYIVHRATVRTWKWANMKGTSGAYVGTAYTVGASIREPV